ncbi:MAG TPA: hypothetical protein VFJ51_01690 [Nitrososphaeraceae archaeon]|nr:hypothetical protein [Nitrososphaeraceae archaeon]
MTHTLKENTDIKQASLDYVIRPNASAILGFEEKLWKTADKMRNNMEIYVIHYVLRQHIGC